MAIILSIKVSFQFNSHGITCRLCSAIVAIREHLLYFFETPEVDVYVKI